MFLRKRFPQNILGENRVTELDFLRGIALIIMVYFHTIRSMHEIFGYQVSYTTLPMFYIGKFAVILFIFISGISFSFSRNPYRRIILLTGISLILSTVTYIYDSTAFIKFGIIHFFAVSSLLAILFKKTNKYMLIIIGILIILAGLRVTQTTVNVNYLFFLGFTNASFQSTDYYPLIPRFGVYLLGMSMAKIVYKDKKSIIWNILNVKPVNFVGRHTLAIYLFHQPIIIGCLYLISLVNR